MSIRDQLRVIKLDSLYGYVDLRSWFRREGDQMIGMYSKIVYGKYGRVISQTEGTTGLVMRLLA